MGSRVDGRVRGGAAGGAEGVDRGGGAFANGLRRHKTSTNADTASKRLLFRTRFRDIPFKLQNKTSVSSFDNLFKMIDAICMRMGGGCFDQACP